MSCVFPELQTVAMDYLPPPLLLPNGENSPANDNASRPDAPHTQWILGALDSARPLLPLKLTSHHIDTQVIARVSDISGIPHSAEIPMRIDTT